jgi:endo-1,4-beta-mannosidase
LFLVLLFKPFVPVHQPRALVECPTGDNAAALSDYTPTETTDFISLRDGHFYAGDTVFESRGVNYYPARSPWRRFLTATSMETIQAEFNILRDAGLNTLRLFLWNQALFACDGAVPVVETFTLLDNIIHEAAAQGFRIIMTLNDLPDLRDYPLYSDPDFVQAQTTFIVQRYREERSILAWDVRNEGDIDYGSIHTFGGGFARPDVLEWLHLNVERIRALDSNHLLTAGWNRDSWSTARYVDFVSFHHYWDDAAILRERILEIRSHTDKPLLLEEFGYSTFERTPEEQAALTQTALQVVDETELLGWLIWAAFDFPLDATCAPSPCLSIDSGEHHFGLWYADYTPKPVVTFLSTEN